MGPAAYVGNTLKITESMVATLSFSGGKESGERKVKKKRKEKKRKTIKAPVSRRRNEVLDATTSNFSYLSIPSWSCPEHLLPQFLVSLIADSIRSDYLLL